MQIDRRRFLTTTTLGLAGVPLLRINSGAVGTEPEILKPPALKAGDMVAISSPAGAVWDPKQVESFVEILKNLGFRVRTGQTLKEKYGYFAGTDEQRAKELNAFFEDPEIKGIFCMKGGWGCARILPLLDYKLIRTNPKIIIGFSDITSLLLGIQSKTGLVTFHGPVGNSGWNDFTVDYLKRVLMNKERVKYSGTGKEEDKPLVLRKGIANGVLAGGNLSVLVSMMGTAYLPDWENKILFLEDTGEEPYKIDRMLTQLKLCGVMDKISAFVFGKCVKCLAEEPVKAFTFQQVLEQQMAPLNIPAFSGAMIGHIENKLTIPLGIKAQVDAERGTITLLEQAVSA
jgi:muramoyltetrapeptide carboxypeptidase